MEAATLTLVLADDHPLYLDGLARHLSGDGRFRLLAVAADGPGAVEACAAQRPAVALVGSCLPKLAGGALLAALVRASATTRPVVLAGTAGPEGVHEAVARGACGYVVKQEPGPVVLDALDRVGRGGTFFSSPAQACLVDAVRARADDGGLPSPREGEILRLLARGATSRQAAERLFVSEATVKSHLVRLYRKLDVADRAAAVAEAMRRGWID